ncbi:MAG: hypothetical protein HYU64_02745 [Armatimonadetes bacterium]|nr:hypothetical protein [Armatimonadota bacterium]
MTRREAYGQVQDESRATYYPKRTEHDGRISWELSVENITRLVRATAKPYPGAFTHNGQATLRI